MLPAQQETQHRRQIANTEILFFVGRFICLVPNGSDMRAAAVEYPLLNGDHRRSVLVRTRMLGGVGGCPGNRAPIPIDGSPIRQRSVTTDYSEFLCIIVHGIRERRKLATGHPNCGWISGIVIEAAASPIDTHDA